MPKHFIDYFKKKNIGNHHLCFERHNIRTCYNIMIFYRITPCDDNVSEVFYQGIKISKTDVRLG